MQLVLDGVFNHVGRNFWAFRDLQANGQYSPYKNWFADLRFDQRSPHGDPFSYAAWNGHFDLVKLNLAEPAAKQHLFDAISMWKEEFQIDGIRLDAADALSFDFLRDLRAFTNQLDPNLWLMGEVIHGDYRQWANPGMLHTTTNYELYKSLFSSFNDSNFFELAYSLNREFGAQGIYRDLATLYKVSSRLSLGANLSNMGPKITYIDAAQADPLPTNLRVGLAAHAINNKYNKLTFVADVNKTMVKRYSDGTSDPFYKAIFTSPWFEEKKTVTESDTTSQNVFKGIISGGAEYWYNDLFALRAGYYWDEDGKVDYFSLGAGIAYNLYRFDFSYVSADEGHPLANTMRFSLSIGF